MVVCIITSRCSGLSSEVLKWSLKAGKIAGTLVLLATEYRVLLCTMGTGALNSVMALLTGEHMNTSSGDTASLIVMAELEVMLKLFITKQQH